MEANNGNDRPARRPGSRAKPPVDKEYNDKRDEVPEPQEPPLPPSHGEDEPPRNDGSIPESTWSEEPPKKSRGKSIIALIAILVILGGLGFLGKKAWDAFSGPEDYDGIGTGEVMIEIKPGDNGGTIARTLKDAGVTKSFDAFYQLSLVDSRAQQIQPGSYLLRKQMSAAAALDALMEPSSKVQAKVTIPEGSRLGQIVEAIDKKTHISAAEVEKVLENPTDIGLPESAEGNPEGFLFPDTYFVAPNATAHSLVSEMVARSNKVTKELDIENRAKEVGLTPHEVLTMASILEYEGKREEDLPKIARVLFNRLEIGMPLQLDSTVSYVSKREGDVWTTAEERADPSAYNTYQHQGLPPGPIGSAGKKTIEAVLNPADGPWLYFLAVDLKTGETAFSETYAEHVKKCKAAFGPQTKC